MDFPAQEAFRAPQASVCQLGMAVTHLAAPACSLLCQQGSAQRGDEQHRGCRPSCSTARGCTRCKRCKCSPAQQESLLGTELCRAQCCASEHRESAVSSAAASPSLQLCSGLCLLPVGSPLECPSVQHCLTSRQMGSRCFPMAGYSLTGAAINFYTVPRVGLTLCCSVCRLGLLKVLLLCAPAVQGVGRLLLSITHAWKPHTPGP